MATSADLAAQARLPGHDVLGLLAHYGRDVAGALQIYDPAAPDEPHTPFTSPIDDAGIGRLLQSPVALPLGNDRAIGKTRHHAGTARAADARLDR